jgi:hypothetical protein
MRLREFDAFDLEVVKSPAQHFEEMVAKECPQVSREP